MEPSSQTERYQRLARDTDAIAEQVLASQEVRGHTATVRVRRDALPDYLRKHWTTTCFVASGRITLVHIGSNDASPKSKGNEPLDLAADELEDSVAMKHPLWSEGWIANLQRDWWAHKHSMQWIAQRNYYQAREDKHGKEHKKDDSARDVPFLDVSSWPGRWAVLRIVER